jgi:hypothetical protein
VRKESRTNRLPGRFSARELASRNVPERSDGDEQETLGFVRDVRLDGRWALGRDGCRRLLVGQQQDALDPSARQHKCL